MDRLSAKSILKTYNLGPKKSFGQNFLENDAILRDIAHAHPLTAEDTVVELGAGLGALTFFLLETQAHVIAVERDRELIPVLEGLFEHSETLELREADAAKFDYAQTFESCGRPFFVMGNLPYQLSSRLLVSLAESASFIKGGTFLVQKEVAKRLAATPGTKIFGLLSVLVQASFDVEFLLEVPPENFIPAPKVDSAVVKFSVKNNLMSQSQFSKYKTVAKAAFSARRKTLRNALSNGLSLGRDDIEQALLASKIDGGRRPETLSLEEFRQLAEVFA